jgi:hypothetical protein
MIFGNNAGLLRALESSRQNQIRHTNFQKIAGRPVKRFSATWEWKLTIVHGFIVAKIAEGNRIKSPRRKHRTCKRAGSGSKFNGNNIHQTTTRVCVKAKRPN